MRRVKELLHHRHHATDASTTSTASSTTTPSRTFDNTNTLERPAAEVVEEEITVTSVSTTPRMDRGNSFTEREEVLVDTTMPATTNVREVAAEVERVEKAPVVQEVIKPGVREEIQPVIHREREQTEIREQVQPIFEKSVAPTIVEERQLAPEIKPEVRLGSMPVIAEGPRSSTLVEAEQRETLVKAPIVEETVHKRIVEEVQPVIHREVVAPVVIQETKPIYEKVVEAPVVTYTTLPAQFVAQPVNQAPLATTTTTTTTVTEQLSELKLQDQGRMANTQPSPLRRC